MIKIAKYEFNSKEQAKQKINALKSEVENDERELELIALHGHSIVELGHIVITQGEYDEDGNELVAPILSDKYLVDVAWWSLDGHPYGWATYAIDIEEGQGVHSFAGIDYQSNKI